MGFLHYVLLGALAYACGWAIHRYKLMPSSKDTSTSVSTTPAYGLQHPVILGYLAGFFGLMLLVSVSLGRFVLHHDGVDIPFVLVNSLVATFVFSFGLLPDQNKHDVPM